MCVCMYMLGGGTGKGKAKEEIWMLTNPFGAASHNEDPDCSVVAALGADGG